VPVRHERRIHGARADVLELKDGLFVVLTEDLHDTLVLKGRNRWTDLAACDGGMNGQGA
jgi:hypothetical protein